MPAKRPDFSTFALPVTLDDGTPVTLRAVRRDDGAKIRRYYARQSQAARPRPNEPPPVL